MSKHPDIEQYLKSLDGLHRAEPKPFFTGRVVNRLQAESEPIVQRGLLRWSWGLTLLAVVILINIFLLVFQSTQEQPILSEYDQTTPDWVRDYTANPSTPIYDDLNK